MCQNSFENIRRSKQDGRDLEHFVYEKGYFR